MKCENCGEEYDGPVDRNPDAYNWGLCDKCVQEEYTEDEEMAYASGVILEEEDMLPIPADWDR